MHARPTYMPPEQMELVLKTIPQLHIRKWKDRDVEMLFLICYWMALRVGEALRLKVEDFDFSSKMIYLGTTKANQDDDIPIPDFFVPELKEWVMQKKSGPIFVPELEYGTVVKWIERLGKILDIPAWTTPQSETGKKTLTHIFRRSMAKDQLYGTYGKRATLPVISQTLRHKGKDPLSSTIKYIGADNEEVKTFWDEVSKQEVAEE